MSPENQRYLIGSQAFDASSYLSVQDTVSSCRVSQILLKSDRFYAGTRQGQKQTLATCRELSKYAAFCVFYSVNFSILNRINVLKVFEH
jgi:hypothetical protein